MGADATARLFFGVDFGEDSPLPHDEDDEEFDPGDIEAFIVAKHGIEDPRDWSKYSRDMGLEERAEWERLRKGYEEAKKPFLDACPLEIVHYGYLMDVGGAYALAIKGTHERYWWSNAVPLRLPPVAAETIERARAWLTENGIVVPKVTFNEHGIPTLGEGDEQEWTWRLTASYG